MARVRDVEIDELPEALRPLYARFAGEYGPFLNQVRVFAHRPPALEHIMGLLLDLADDALLPRRQLEIALVTVSRLNAAPTASPTTRPGSSSRASTPTPPPTSSRPIARASTASTGWCATSRLR